jgi:hypothetical protein
MDFFKIVMALIFKDEQTQILFFRKIFLINLSDEKPEPYLAE